MRHLDSDIIPAYTPFAPYTPIIQESPESIIAEQNYKAAFKLLDKVSERKHEQKINEIGASVIQVYLSRLNSEDAASLQGCYFEERQERNLFGRVKSRGMVFRFVR